MASRWARRSRWSPTGGFPARRAASASATSRRRRRSAGPRAGARRRHRAHRRGRPAHGPAPRRRGNRRPPRRLAAAGAPPQGGPARQIRRPGRPSQQGRRDARRAAPTGRGSTAEPALPFRERDRRAPALRCGFYPVRNLRSWCGWRFPLLSQFGGYARGTEGSNPSPSTGEVSCEPATVLKEGS